MSTLEDMQSTRGGAVPVLQGARGKSPASLPWPLIGLTIAVLDFLVLASLASLVGHIYFRFLLHARSEWHTHLELGATIAGLVVAALAVRGVYGRERLAQRPPQALPIATSLFLGMMTLLVVMFMTKSNAEYSRSVIILTFVGALPLMIMLHRAEGAIIGRLALHRRLVLPQVMLVGSGERIRDDGVADELERAGYAVAGRAALNLSSSDAEFEHDTRLLSAAVRIVKPDSLLLCLPWGETAKLHTCISILSENPASIHIEADPYLRQLSGQRDDPLGFLVVGRPLSQTQLSTKRVADIVLSAAALFAVAPIMIAAALAIRIETPGAALFTQQRYGYNREPFRIFKFRTMRVQEDDAFKQASRNDDRITRVGRFLRRTNIDELPQLINVLVGDMSLVGPRPHPIELDRQFTPLINRYTERHRVRPGITGWAQVNGFRGETDTTDKMQGRIAHDLFYLNNWSFWLDLRIMLRTMLSATAYRNAR